VKTFSALVAIGIFVVGLASYAGDDRNLFHRRSLPPAAEPDRGGKVDPHHCVFELALDQIQFGKDIFWENWLSEERRGGEARLISTRTLIAITLTVEPDDLFKSVNPDSGVLSEDLLALAKFVTGMGPDPEVVELPPELLALVPDFIPPPPESDPAAPQRRAVFLRTMMATPNLSEFLGAQYPPLQRFREVWRSRQRYSASEWLRKILPEHLAVYPMVPAEQNEFRTMMYRVLP